MARGPDFFKQMTQAQIDALEEFARHPGKTIENVTEYLADIQVRTSRSAVGRWLQDFRLWDRNQRASEVAKTYLANLSETDPTAVTDASIKKFNELVFEALASGDQLDPGELMKLSIAMKTGLGAQQLVNELKRLGNEQMERLKQAATRKQLTQDDIEEARKAMFG